MPRLEVAAAAVAISALVAAAGCSRLTFVKPSAARGKSTQVAPEYEFSGGGRADAALDARRGLYLAQQRLLTGDLDAAEQQARAVLDDAPDTPAAYTILAAVAERRGRAEDAGRHYARAAELAPKAGPELNNYGAWLCGNGRPADALAWFDRAIAAPGYAQRSSALANAGACALRAGQASRVERDLRAALELDPEDPVALSAMAEYRYGAGRYLEARAFSERRLSAAPSSPAALLLASQIEEKLGDKAAAARYVQRLRTEFPQARTAQSGEKQAP